MYPITPKQASTYNEIRDAALNPNSYGLSISKILELMLIDDEEEFMKRLGEMVKEIKK